MVPVPYTQKGLKEFYQTITDKLDHGAVVGIFPEGETTQELRRVRPGFAHIATRLGVPALPVAVYDANGILQLGVGELIDPPDSLREKEHFAEDVMNSIAHMLPPHLRGYYSGHVHE